MRFTQNASVLTFAAFAGTAFGAADAPAIGVPVADAPRQLMGHIYFNAATGASVFTPANEYLANRASGALRAIGDDINGDGRPDVWINTNIDPCPIGTTTSPNVHLGTLDTPSTAGDHHLYKSQLGHPTEADYTTDMLVNSFSFTFWTDLEDTDTNGDTIPDGNTAGHGIELTFWDKEDFFGSTCCICPDAGGPGFTRERVVTFALTDLPGALTAPVPGFLAGFVLTFDLGSSNVFELADSDGVGPANGNFNPFIAATDTDTNGDTIPDVACADTNGNGTIDWSFSLRGIQPTDGRAATIAYSLAAPGRAGTAGQVAVDCVTPLNAQAGVSGDGLFDYVNVTTAPGPLQWDASRILRDSVETPMGLGFPFTSYALGEDCPTLLSRFSMFLASLGETPDPDGDPPVSAFACAGESNSDFFGWGGTHPVDGGFYGGLNCGIDDDGDTIPDGRPWNGAFLALSGGASGGCTFADCDKNYVLNIDDIDCFVAGFLAGDLATSDCDGNGICNIDDIDCFVDSFLSGCP